MRTPIWLTLVIALVVFAATVVVGQMVVDPNLPLIASASFLPETITPDADGVDDVTVFSYALSRSALLSLTFEGEDGERYVFRDRQPRPSGEYSVNFSGVVDGKVLSGEQIAGAVIQRLLPNGSYTWRLSAAGTERAESAEMSGMLVVKDADAVLPEMTVFSVAPDVFSPNQDGIDDRTVINVYLTKDAYLTVYLEGGDGERFYIPERKEGRKLGEAGRHLFDYDGGIDRGSDPPPDGAYTVVAVAEDAVGQIIQSTAALTIEQGGKPLAEIVPQTVGVDVVFDVVPYEDRYFSNGEKLGDLIAPPEDPQALTLTPITMPVGDVLIFKLTVENYGKVPIRTSGPPPGTVYQQDQNAASLGELDQSGAWRVGIKCETSLSDFPWRWAIGAADNLVSIDDPATGNIYYYLMPGERSVVWGGVRMTNLVRRRNPQACWAALIHEDVEISLRNNNVGRREVELVDPNASS